MPPWKNCEGHQEGWVGLEEAAAFPLSGSTGAGNEVIMLLMGRDKRRDQGMSTIAEQQRAGEGSGRARLEIWGTGWEQFPGAFRVS